MKRKTGRMVSWGVAVVGVVVAATCVAVPEMVPTGNLRPVQGTGNLGNRGFAHAVDGSGLVGDAHTSTAANNMYEGNGGDSSVWIELTDGVLDLHSLKVWNGNNSGSPLRAVQDVDIYISTSDTEVYNRLFSDLDWWTPVGSYTWINAPHADGYDTPQTISLIGTSARWIGFHLQTTYGDTYWGISEIQVFKDVPAKGTLITIQ